MRQGRALPGVNLFVVGLFALLSAEAFRNPNILPRELYSYDEADYVYAAEKGLLANYVTGARRFVRPILAGRAVVHAPGRISRRVRCRARCAGVAAGAPQALPALAAAHPLRMS